MTKILFVCTGNVFRSMVAEKCLKDYLAKNNIKNIKVDSAGIDPVPQEPQAATIERLKFHSISFKHTPKKLTKELINANDLVVAMNLNHQEFIKTNFGINAPLYEEIALNKHEGVLDFNEFNPQIVDMNDKKEYNDIHDYAFRLVDFIHDSTPRLVANIRNRTDL